MLREVQVKPEFAAEYPYLVRGRWYTAAAIAGLVKGTRIMREGPDIEFHGRILSAEHFLFRGGSPRQGSWAGLRSRRSDRRRVPAAAMAGG